MKKDGKKKGGKNEGTDVNGVIVKNGIILIEGVILCFHYNMTVHVFCNAGCWWVVIL